MERCARLAVLTSTQLPKRDVHLYLWSAKIQWKSSLFCRLLRVWTWFDTPENRMITSGLTSASFKRADLGHPAHYKCLEA